MILLLGSTELAALVTTLPDIGSMYSLTHNGFGTYARSTPCYSFRISFNGSLLSLYE